VPVIERVGTAEETEHLWVGVLGPLMIVRDGTEVQGLPAGQRAVLGLLALACGRPVHRDWLIDMLWGDEPPVSAAAIIHTYISRLRSPLGKLPTGVGRIPASPRSSYRLLVTAGELDLVAFRRSAGEAREAREAGDLIEACDAFERALGVWRGEPLADVDLLRRHPSVIALAEERVQVVLEFADAAAGSGRHEQVLPHLRELATRDPLDEASHARLLVALAGTGRQVEALAEYEGLRKRLDEQLGVLPGPALREAHIKVLRQDISPQIAPVPRLDDWLPVFQLPAAPADFTGREADCDGLSKALAGFDDNPGVPMVVICGPPGIGKTTMALFAAHSIRSQFPDGQLWVQLAGASARPREPGDVLGDLLRALGVPGPAIPDDQAERAAYYRSRLAGRKVLVVADDAASAAQVRPLIPGTAGCALVVTSRTWLEGLDGAYLMPLGVMSSQDCAGLLSRIVGQHRVDAEPTAVDELVAVCGALPLALRIAAAKLAARPSWPVSAMVRRLTGEHTRLRELEAGDVSVRASIASSYQSLAERPRRAFRLLALLGPADFAGWVAGALLGEPDAADVIDELTSRSLLTSVGVDATGEPRYRLHDLLRDYAAGCLAEEPAANRDAALEQLVAGWLQLAQAAEAKLQPEPYFPPPAEWSSREIIPQAEAERLTATPIAWFTAERVNLLAAVDQACQAGHLGLARQLASRQCAFHHLQDRYDDAESLWRTIAEYAGKAPELASYRNYAWLRVGAAMVERGQAADALPVLTRCVESAQQRGQADVLCIAWYWRGSCAVYLDDFDRGRVDAGLGIDAAREAGSVLGELLNLRMLSEVLAKTGDGEGALEASERAVAIAAELGVASYELAALHSLAYTCTLTGRSDRAVTVSLRRLKLSRDLGDVRGEALSLGVLGDAYQALGKYKLAADHLHRALPLFRAHHAVLHQAVCLMKLGYAYEAMGSFALAASYLEQSQVLTRRLRLPGKVEQAQRALDRCRAAASGRSSALTLTADRDGGAELSRRVISQDTRRPGE
jgi:DNA-binding SARP family transcriptional activator